MQTTTSTHAGGNADLLSGILGVEIIGYFNRTYNVSVPVPEIDGDTLKMGFRPQYMTYVDTVIEHISHIMTGALI